MVAKIIEVGDNNFEAEVVQSDLPVLIDFWAPWCGPCKSIAPVVDEIAGEYEGRLKVTKINVDNNPMIPSRYGVRGIPNLIILKGGTVKEQIVGAVPKAKLIDAIEKALA
ncbi:MAG: thioredoxin [Candidatus Binatia bacterium]